MNTISKIRTHPRLKELYQERRCEVRFYGDTSYLPVEFANITDAPVNPFEGPPNHIIYFGLESKSPHDYSLKLAHQFILKNNRPPTWEDMVELYYGNRMVKPLDIMIGYNRIYARTGIPHLLEGYDRIYVTAVTPLVLSQTAFRKILYDYLYNHQDAGRDYKEIDPKELKRSRLFNEANKDTVTGLTRKYENLVYPLPGIVWPTELE